MIEQDDAGYFAYSPELPGCYSQGNNYEEALENIKEAVDLYLETLEPEERIQFLSKQISTSSVDRRVTAEASAVTARRSRVFPRASGRPLPPQGIPHAQTCSR